MKQIFEVLENITHHKNAKMDVNFNNYSPFMVDQGLSQHPDFLIYAHLANQLGNITPKAHYLFHLRTIPKSSMIKRGKWTKRKNNVDHSTIDAIMEEYNYSIRKSVKVSRLLSEDQIEFLKEKQKQKYGG